MQPEGPLARVSDMDRRLLAAASVLGGLAMSACTHSAGRGSTPLPAAATSAAVHSLNPAGPDPSRTAPSPYPSQSVPRPPSPEPAPVVLPVKTTPRVASPALSGSVMSDANVGWGEFVRGASSTIAVTQDGGERWTGVVVPARCHADWLPFRVAGRTAEFMGSSALDNLQLNSTVTLCRTRDLGRTWSVISQFDVHGGPGRPHFFDATHAWLVSGVGGAMHSAGNTYLYRTSDGGLSWHEVAAQVVTNNLPGVGTSFGNLPRGCSLAFSFVSALKAWATNGCGQGGGGVDTRVIAKYVSVTSDGGHTWRAVTLPQRTVAGGRTGCLLGAACGVETLVTSGERVVLAAGGYDAVGALYVSDDGGHTWSVRVLPEPQDWATVRGRTFYAARPDGDRQWSSSDDGRTWRRRTPAVRLIDPASIHFVNARVGFRTTQPPNGPGVFQRTDDAGRRWRTLHPVLVRR